LVSVVVQQWSALFLEPFSSKLVDWNALDTERNYSSTNLDSHSVILLQSQLVLEQDDGSELRLVVLNIEAISFALDDSVTPRNTNVIDSHFTLMPSSKLKLAL
jgi:hypothetical protein